MTDRPLVAVFDLVTSIGGVQTVMAGLLPRLADQFDIVAIDPYDNPEYAALMTRAGIRVVSLGPAPQQRYIGGKGLGRVTAMISRTPWMLLTAARLRRWVRQNHPALIHFNQPRAAYLFGRLLPRNAPPLVYHAHGFVSAQDVPHGAFLSKRFARFLAVSGLVAKQLGQGGVDPGKIVLAYNAVDADDICRRAGKQIQPLPNRPPGTVVFTHVAMLTQNKGQHLAIEAMANMPFNAYLWFCGDTARGGDASYRKALEKRVVDLNLQQRVHFLGWRDDVPCVLASSDVAILPSRAFESFGMVLAEAMALSKPCLGSDVGGIPEVIDNGRTGLLSQPNDVSSLAEAMRKMIESPQMREAMGREGRDRVQRLFGPCIQAQTVSAAWTSALGWTRT